MCAKSRRMFAQRSIKRWHHPHLFKAIDAFTMSNSICKVKIMKDRTKKQHSHWYARNGTKLESDSKFMHRKTIIIMQLQALNYEVSGWCAANQKCCHTLFSLPYQYSEYKKTATARNRERKDREKESSLFALKMSRTKTNLKGAKRKQKTYFCLLCDDNDEKLPVCRPLSTHLCEMGKRPSTSSSSSSSSSPCIIIIFGHCLSFSISFCLQTVFEVRARIWYWKLDDVDKIYALSPSVYI